MGLGWRGDLYLFPRGKRHEFRSVLNLLGWLLKWHGRKPSQGFGFLRDGLVVLGQG